ncbi:MAG: glycosyltransferase family 9 protein [Bacteroidetes bacterium]|nr:MAG: glycosyltransferase family 9 protein [Bacteroidota bacterium]
MQILVIQTAFIGDAVLGTGVLENLHQAFPKADIHYMVRQGNEGLFAEHPFIKHLWVWNKKTQKYKHLWQLLLQIRSQKFDYVINLQRFAATGLLTAFSGAKHTIGFTKNPLSLLFTTRVKHTISTQNTLHEYERNHTLIQPLTNTAPSKPALYPTTAHYAFVKQYQIVPYITIAPSSVWFTKQWPAHQWIRFIQALPQNLTIYLLGAPSDDELCISIGQQCSTYNVISLCGKLNFLQSAALQQGATMNYVNDSAPMHFASSVNAPVTAVYCSTVPSFGFGPLSSKSFIVETKQTLACRPCGLHGKKHCPLGHFNCAETIEVSQLVSSLPM